MFTNEISIVTPSYHIDYEACRLLVESINRHVPANIRHYIIVPKADYCLFKNLESERTIIKFQEDFCTRLVDNSFHCFKKMVFKLKNTTCSRLIRQQIVKVATGEFLPEDVFLIIDSDTFFVADFDFKKFVKNGDVSFYCEELEKLIPSHQKWQENSGKMFKLNPPTAHLRSMLAPSFSGDEMFYRKCSNH